MIDTTIRVLLVEDQDDDAELTRLAFSASSKTRYVLQRSRSLDEAAAALEQDEFDLVLLDLGLQTTSGLDTLVELRRFAPSLPIVVLSGDDDDDTMLAALDAGAQDYLPKSSVSRDALKRAVRHAIQRQQSQAEIRELLERLQRSQRDLERKNRRLEELYETANRFVDNVSHEFRTPLTVIREYTSLMRDGIGGTVSPQHRHFLDVVTDRTDDLAHMVDDMLDISKLEAGLLGIRRKECHLADVVHYVRTGLERKAAIKRLSLDIDLDPALPSVFCDPEKVGRILVNLVVNAVKFTPEEGRIEVSAGYDPQTNDVCVSIADNGPGIEPRQLQAIFERFRQLGAPTRSTSKGFGLGLSIARDLVGLNFGQIGVESQPGQGSRFWFTLPRADRREVLGRYLANLEGATDAPRAVTLITINVGPAETTPQEIDAFLNYLLRRHDLVFRLSNVQWLLLLAAGADDVDGFITRAAEVLSDTNRNRPGGPLPAVCFDVKGTWPLGVSVDELLEAAQCEPCCV